MELCTAKFNAGGYPAIDYHLTQGGVEIILVPSHYRNRAEHWHDGPLGSYADSTIYLYTIPYFQVPVRVVR